MKGRRFTLTTRLTALFTLVSATMLLGIGMLVTMEANRHFAELDHAYLEDKAMLLEHLVMEASSRPDLVRRVSEIQNSHQGLILRLALDEEEWFRTPGFDFPAASHRLPPPGRTFQWHDEGLSLRGIHHEARLANPALGTPKIDSTLRIDVAMDLATHAHFLDQLRLTLLAYLLLAVVASGLLGWWAVRRGLAPLRVMRSRARQVTAHKLDARMPIEAVPEEMADLAHSLNAMLDRLEEDFRKLMEFSDDLAHELRTPISNLMTQTQVSLSQARDAAAYREVLASNAEEFQRLARMISDMLYLAKTESEVDLPHPEPVALDAQVQALFDFYDAVAEDKSVRLTLDGQGTVQGDRLMLRRAISNLLSNAIRHATPGTSVQVRIEDTPDRLRLCLSNQGATIDAAHLPRLFDRFYRVDKSRHHTESDGTGLGLAITQAIMKAHGGNVSVTSADGTTLFCLEFPSHGLHGRA